VVRARPCNLAYQKWIFAGLVIANIEDKRERGGEKIREYLTISSELRVFPELAREFK
jgi:hypothetical protein